MHLCSIAYVCLFTGNISISNDYVKYGSLCKLKGLQHFGNKRFLLVSICKAKKHAIGQQ